MEGRQPQKFNFQSRKFKELILYFSQRGLDEGLVIGSTKLNKLLFFTDFEAYGRLGQPVTGATYQRLQWGPAPRELLWVRDQLLRDDEVRWKEKPENEWDDVLVPESAANLDLFSQEEIAIADEIFDEMRPYNATASSDLSHERSAGWRVQGDRETIPYESVFVSTEPVPGEAIELGRKLMDSYGRQPRSAVSGS
jgi:hypothetical protein